jgi:HlyD family secretion protein
MTSPAVFRKVALNRLASPEQIDQLMQVTTPKGWVALAAFGLLILVALVWGVAGSIPEKVSGQGLLIKTGGVLEITALGGGRVTDLSVAPGDSVAEGQVVARVEQPEIADRLRDAKAQLVNLEAEHAKLVAFGQGDLALQSAYLARQRENTVQSIAAEQQRLAQLGERVVAQEQLVSKGLITRSALLATRDQYDALREKIRADSSTVAQVAVQLLTLRHDRLGPIRTSQFKVNEARITVQQLERQLQQSAEVTSPYTGRILEVMTEVGSLVARGDPVMTLDLTGRTVKDLEAIVYVPSVEGKRVRVGMSIQIAPSTVKQEEYGMMLGRVTYVSDFPATGRGMRRVLKNEQLVSVLSGGGAPYEVHADLIPDLATPSQYKWSSSHGPPSPIQSGTLAAGNIIVRTERPIALVIPLFRKYTGI